GPLRQRPVRHAEQATEEVDEAVHLDREVVGLVAEMGEPARVLHHEVEDIAVDHEIALAVDAGVDGVLHHVDAAEMRAVILAQELVVIARHVDDLGALARLAQHLLHEVVVRLRPVPIRLQRPAVDDVADHIDGVGVVAAQEIQQSVGLRAAGSEMDIAAEETAEGLFGALITQGVTSHARALTDSYDRPMTVRAATPRLEHDLPGKPVPTFPDHARAAMRISRTSLHSANSSAMRQSGDTGACNDGM